MDEIALDCHAIYKILKLQHHFIVEAVIFCCLYCCQLLSRLHLLFQGHDLFIWPSRLMSHSFLRGWSYSDPCCLTLLMHSIRVTEDWLWKRPLQLIWSSLAQAGPAAHPGPCPAKATHLKNTKLDFGSQRGLRIPYSLPRLVDSHLHCPTTPPPQGAAIQPKGICLHFAGQALKVSAEAFTSDPCDLPKRQAVVQAARSLLAAVTRLLILADMVDVAYLLEHLTVVSRI